MVAPEIGLPLTAAALGAALFVVVVLMATELEQDVVQVGLLGAVLGGLVEVWFLGQDWWHGALFGLLVGSLLGDELQLSHKWLLLTRQAKAEQRWWQRLPTTSRWLPRAVWVAFAVALVALVSLPYWLPYDAGSRLTGDFFTMFRERRIESSVWANLLRVWFVIVPLCVAIALSRFAARVPNQQLVVDGLLRRVAVLQCAALLMMAVYAIGEWIITLSYPPTHTHSYTAQLAAYVDTLRLALVPCMLLMLSQVFLGKRLFLYWRTSGWIVALGALGMLTVATLGYLIVFALERVA